MTGETTGCRKRAAEALAEGCREGQCASHGAGGLIGCPSWRALKECGSGVGRAATVSIGRGYRGACMYL